MSDLAAAVDRMRRRPEAVEVSGVETEEALVLQTG